MFVRSTVFSSAAPLRRLQTVVAACAVACALAAPDAYAQGNSKKQPQTYNVLPITVTDVTLNGMSANSLTFTVSGLIGTQPFTDELLTVTAQNNPANAACPILNLELGAIELSVLGLNVITSDICLRITAYEGAGLLGDLLCAVANLLDDGLGLNLTTQFTAAQINQVRNALVQILNGALQQATSSQAVASATCSVLSLSVGPLDLNLLGLRVELDDCAGGPVTVDITATAGGGLLGDLLCNLSNLLKNPNANRTAILGVLRDIVSAIGGLLG